MNTIKIDVTLTDGTQLSFDDAKREEYGYMKLDNDRRYTLAPNYTLYKMVGNVLCGEQVEYDELTIKITKN